MFASFCKKAFVFVIHYNLQLPIVHCHCRPESVMACNNGIAGNIGGNCILFMVCYM